MRSWLRIKLIAFVFLITAGGISFFIFGFGKPSGLEIINSKINGFLEARLYLTDFADGAASFEETDKKRRAIYVLGGTQASLRAKYPVAVSLYGDRAPVIWVMHSEGITEYDSDLGRNLTNTEWTIKLLNSYGVQRQDIEFVKIEPGLFGTFSEARALVNITGDQGIQKLYLVCSFYHSKRVEAAFMAFFQDSKTKFEILVAKESAGTRTLLLEYGKLLFYKYFLIPYKQWRGRHQASSIPGQIIINPLLSFYVVFFYSNVSCA